MDSELHRYPSKSGLQTFSTSKDLFTRPTVNKLFKSKSRLVECFFFTRLKTTVVDIFMFSVNNFNCIHIVLYALYEYKIDMYNLFKQARHHCCNCNSCIKKLIMYYELTNLLQRLRTLTSLRNAMTLSRSGDCKLQAL